MFGLQILRRLITLFGVVLLVFPGVAAAEGTEPRELPTLVVESETYRSTATKSALEPEETPGSITVIDSEALERRGGDSVSEALRYTPGVTPELRGGGITRLDQYTIRGFQNYQTAYDGLLLLFNGWNLQPQIDLAAVERVEVFKGPASVLYGNQPPGGLVNLLAKQPSVDRYNELRFALGSRNLVEVQGEFTGQVADSPISYSVVALGRQRDGQAITSEEERYLFAPTVNWQLTPDTSLNLNLYYQDDPSAGIYNSLPAKGTVYSNPNGRLEPDAYAGDANYNTFDRQIIMPGYQLAHRFGQRWSFLQNARLLKGDLYQENTYNTGLEADGRTLNRRAYRTEETSEGITIDNQLSGWIDFAGMQHHLLLGLDYLKLESGIIYQDTIAAPLDLYDPNNRAIDPDALRYDIGLADVRSIGDLRALLDFRGRQLSSDFDLEYEQTGVYLQDQVRLGRWILIAGGRYDRYEQREDGRKYGFEVRDTFEQTDFNGRVGMLYQFDNGFSPYVSYSESFEALAGTDRNGNKFVPAEAAQWEAGVKYSSFDYRHTVTLSAFNITKENDLTRDPQGGPYDLIQAGEIRSRGVELEAFSEPLHNLRLSLNATLLDAEITRDNRGLAGKTPVWVIEESASLWANYAFDVGPWAGLDVGAGLRYAGKTQLDSLNSDTVPSRTLVDTSVLYDLGQLHPRLTSMTATLTAANVFDETYYTCFDANNCWFGEERIYEAGLRYVF
ncbi:MAG: TonB-dependent siderophore receptor [Pseudomonadota bacterium]|nr:TonB-dependent siderophore receptor [Pseudomonadota bacterium]